VQWFLTDLRISLSSNQGARNGLFGPKIARRTR
jgi:hypothetical protein